VAFDAGKPPQLPEMVKNENEETKDGTNVLQKSNEQPHDLTE
jgi:hypothetical protein